MPILRQRVEVMPQPNSIGLSITRVLALMLFREHWHIWALLALMPFRAKPPKPSEVTKTFSAFGQTLIRTFRFSGKQRPNTRGYSRSPANLSLRRECRSPEMAAMPQWIVQRPADSQRSVVSLELVEKAILMRTSSRHS